MVTLVCGGADSKAFKVRFDSIEIVGIKNKGCPGEKLIKVLNGVITPDNTDTVRQQVSQGMDAQNIPVMITLGAHLHHGQEEIQERIAILTVKQTGAVPLHRPQPWRCFGQTAPF